MNNWIEEMMIWALATDIYEDEEEEYEYEEELPIRTEYIE